MKSLDSQPGLTQVVCYIRMVQQAAAQSNLEQVNRRMWKRTPNEVTTARGGEVAVGMGLVGRGCMKSLVVWWHLCCIVAASSDGLRLPQTAAPLRRSFPFLALWNAPSELCASKFGVALNLASFPMVSTTRRSPFQQDVRIFFNGMIGRYPHYDGPSGREVNGGVPQQADMAGHLLKAGLDIGQLIPSNTSRGLAVIDWESWRPVWSRNWHRMSVYQRQSVELVQQRDLSLTRPNATAIAKAEFEEAARTFLVKSLQLAKKLRPRQLWGFYLFPNCYNNNMGRMRGLNRTYTGRCPQRAVSRNNELAWLWRESTALYPSVYLPKAIQSTDKAKLFVRHQVQEAMRVAALSRGQHTIPVYVYTRVVYRDAFNESLSQADLVSTIGESAALGAAGIVVWESSNTTINNHTCNMLQSHMDDVLNHYVLNVTQATRLCSRELCGSKGRCLRRHWDSDDYLHLNPNHFKIRRKANGRLQVTGRASPEDLLEMAERFTCQCYAGKACNSQ
ncbi:hyaluronidase PH-20-like [Leucoraja erinacea]|uniref:hyaluronidase PH-20-like n=1 Tax=Leucoraja erinaceus TaxID=7782 RepID=UPI00245872FD|nr:hyaluronidase PH-20-like [Leucoraja erinacea]